MEHVWWRTHLRKLPELGFLAQFGDFEEVDAYMPFLTDALGLPAGGRVLDLGCGRGSFAVRLAQWGNHVTASDDSEPLMQVAREEAERRDVTVEFRCSDPRSLPERGVFDGALMLDFGSAADADNAAMMRAVAAALKPGGKLLFGTCNPYYWAREPRTEHRVAERIDVIRKYRFDFTVGAVVSRVRCVLADGERRALPEARYRAYTLPELRALTSSTGLADLSVYGEDEEGRPLPDRGVAHLSTPFFHCVALRPVHGEAGEGI